MLEDKEKKIAINLDDINIENALYIYQFLNRVDRNKLSVYFGRSLRFPYSKDDELRKIQFEASPYFVKLKKICNKFNQRDDWNNENYCPITHNLSPINNQSTKLIVQQGEIRIVDIKDFQGSSFLLEFVDFGKFKGNAQYFAEIYKEDILKAASLLIPFKIGRN